MVRILKIPFLFLWRAWFYILIFSTLILFSPIFLMLTSKESYYASFWKFVRVWCWFLIYAMGFYVKMEREEKLDRSQSYMFCANHGSFMDGFLLAAISKNPIVFVGKKELVNIPIFGFFYKRVVIMVDRSSPKSRKRVYELAKKRLKNGTSIAIFPEGLVPTEDVVLSEFRNGAFSLAIEHQIPIVPQSYYDCKRMFSWNLFKGGPGVFRVKQHAFIPTKGMTSEDKDTLKAQTFELLHEDLLQDKAYMKDTNYYKNELQRKS